MRSLKVKSSSDAKLGSRHNPTATRIDTIARHIRRREQFRKDCPQQFLRHAVRGCFNCDARDTAKFLSTRRSCDQRRIADEVSSVPLSLTTMCGHVRPDQPRQLPGAPHAGQRSSPPPAPGISACSRRPHKMRNRRLLVRVSRRALVRPIRQHRRHPRAQGALATTAAAEILLAIYPE